MKLTVLPVTPDRWCDLESVFTAKGCSIPRGCWCMFYRRSGARGPWPEGMRRAEANGADLKALVDAGRSPGLIAYRGDVVWFGAKSMYDRASFKEVARRKPTRPVVRLKVR